MYIKLEKKTVEICIYVLNTFVVTVKKLDYNRYSKLNQNQLRMRELRFQLTASASVCKVDFVFCCYCVLLLFKIYYLSQRFAISFAMLIYLVYVIYCNICDRL